MNYTKLRNPDIRQTRIVIVSSHLSSSVAHLSAFYAIPPLFSVENLTDSSKENSELTARERLQKVSPFFIFCFSRLALF